MVKGPRSDGPGRKPSTQPSESQSESAQDGPRPRKPARGPSEGVQAGPAVPTRRPTRQASEISQDGTGRRPSRPLSQRGGSVYSNRGSWPSSQSSGRTASFPIARTGNTRDQHQTQLSPIVDASPGPIEAVEAIDDVDDQLGPLHEWTPMSFVERARKELEFLTKNHVASPTQSSDDERPPSESKGTGGRQKTPEPAEHDPDDHASNDEADDSDAGGAHTPQGSEAGDEHWEPDDWEMEDDPQTERVDNNDGAGGEEMEIDPEQTKKAEKRKSVEDPPEPTTKKRQAKRTKSTAEPPGGPTVTQEETDIVSRAADSIMAVLGSVLRRNARAGIRDGISDARAAAEGNRQKTGPAIGKKKPATQDNCRSKGAGGCGRPYIIGGPAVECSWNAPKPACRKRKFCTECRDVSHKGIWVDVDGTNTWFCSDECRGKDPSMREFEVKRREEEYRQRKEKEDAETARLAAKVKQAVEGSNLLKKAKKEAKEKKAQEAEAERERLEQEEAEQEEIAAAKRDAKPSEPIADKCAKCKKVWGRRVVHAECQFDGCQGHSLCEICKGTDKSKTKFTGGWTVDTPYEWFCSFECRKGWYDELDEDEKANRDSKNGDLPQKKKSEKPKK